MVLSASQETLIKTVYPELRAIAGRLLRGERSPHTLQRTALAHEAILRLFRSPLTLGLPSHEFLALAAHQMRMVLIDYARKHRAQRRGGAFTRVPLFENEHVWQRDDDDWLAMNNAMDRLSKVRGRAASVVDLKFFAGFTTCEIAAILGVSDGTVESDWAYAKAWLYRELMKTAVRI